MGYRQTELRLSRTHCHLACAIVRQISFRFRLPFHLPRLSLYPLPTPAEVFSTGAGSALTSSPRTPTLFVFLLSSASFLLLRVFVDSSRSSFPSSNAPSFTFPSPSSRRKCVCPILFPLGGDATDRILCNRLLNYSRSIGSLRGIRFRSSALLRY